MADVILLIQDSEIQSTKKKYWKHQDRATSLESNSDRILTHCCRMADNKATVLAGKSVNDIKILRRKTRYRQTLLVKRLQAYFEQRSREEELKNLRKSLVSLQSEITELNEALVSKSPGENVQKYQQRLDERIAACHQLIDDYLQSPNLRRAF